MTPVCAEYNVSVLAVREGEDDEPILTEPVATRANTVCLPYALRDGETPDGVWSLYVAPDGDTERMTGDRGYTGSHAVFTTDHFSRSTP